MKQMGSWATQTLALADAVVVEEEVVAQAGPVEGELPALRQSLCIYVYIYICIYIYICFCLTRRMWQNIAKCYKMRQHVPHLKQNISKCKGFVSPLWKPCLSWTRLEASDTCSWDAISGSSTQADSCFWGVRFRLTKGAPWSWRPRGPYSSTWILIMCVTQA